MSLRLFLLAIGLTARAVFAAAELQAPKTVMVGKEVELRLTDGGKPIAQAEIRITSPSAQAATVNTAVAILRSSPFTLSQVKAVTYQGDRLLVLEKRSDNWCLAIAPAGATGFITCESLDVAAYNGPLGFTDAQGNFSTANLAVAPSTIEVTAFRSNQPIACTKLRVTPYTYDRTETITKSITYRERRFVRADGDGPFTMQILEVDPTDPDLDILPVRANDRAIGRETMSSLAKRYGAKAAVNSGYFVTTGPYSGASAGAYLWNGEVVSNGRNRTVLLLCAEQNGVEKIDTDIVNFEGKITTSKGLSHAVTGVNRPRGANDLIVYRPMLGPTTLTDRDGVEAIVDARGRVVKVEDGAGNTEIPRDGYVISASGAAADWLRSKVSQGSAIQLDLQLKPSRPDTCKATDIVGGGPLLVRNGKAMPSQENLAHEAKRHPRTAAGYTRRGTILFVTVDGRQSSSAGMRIDELAQELVSLGAVEAVNLDGGGSTTMLVNGRIRNSPSDGVERPVSDGLLVLTGGEHRRGFSQSSKH